MHRVSCDAGRLVPACFSPGMQELCRMRSPPARAVPPPRSSKWTRPTAVRISPALVSPPRRHLYSHPPRAEHKLFKEKKTSYVGLASLYRPRLAASSLMSPTAAAPHFGAVCRAEQHPLPGGQHAGDVLRVLLQQQQRVWGRQDHGRHPCV